MAELAGAYPFVVISELLDVTTVPVPFVPMRRRYAERIHAARKPYLAPFQAKLLTLLSYETTGFLVRFRSLPHTIFLFY